MNNDGRSEVRLSSLVGGSETRVFKCLEVWKIPPELMVPSKDGMGEQKRYESLKELIISRVGPFEKNKFTGSAQISSSEEGAVIFFMLLVLGGPLFLFLVLVPFTVVAGTWHHKLALTLTILCLALHPLPRVNYNLLRSSWFAYALYKYFSYRIMWCDLNWEKAINNKPWIAASAPHGVLPFAQILCMLAVNSIGFCGRFVGAPASVVFRTPFLRYILLLGPCCEVSGKAITREVFRGNSVGLVADGIAGIFRCNEETETVFLKNRKGLARLSLRTGISLLPSYSLGNTQSFSAWFDSMGQMEKISRKTKASFLLFWGRFGLPIPRRNAITQLYGSPIEIPGAISNPSNNQIDHLHQRLLDGMQNIFDLHKDAAGYGHKKMKFV